ncbi:MAG: flagellar hook-length control protein FliK [Nitrospinota bacterium]|nr:flagellar hook-length control protein FliK [Nitrospinota bacterium]
MLSENLSPNSLRPIFSNALSLKLETIKLDVFVRNFSTGQILPGKVVHVLPEQKAVVEFQGEKLLLQFARPVSQGQSITVKIEQTHPSPILKLIEPSVSPVSSQKTATGESLKTTEISNSNTSASVSSDKTTLLSRGSQPIPDSQEPIRNSESIPLTRESLRASGNEKNGHSQSLNKTIGEIFSKSELKNLGIDDGQKVRAEVIQVTDRQTVQVRLGKNLITVKNTFFPRLQPGETVSLQIKSISAGKYVFELEALPVPPCSNRSLSDLSILKNYLPGRQSIVEMLSVLKEAFLDHSVGQLKALKIDQASMEQLQANLQRLVARESKTPEASQLREILDRSGFHYEAKVKEFVSAPTVANRDRLLENDLKGQLMRLARELEQVSPASVENTASNKWIGKLIAQVNQAISNIELQQLTHHFSREVQQPLLLHLPENLMGEEDRFKIYILPDQGGGNHQEPDLQNRVFNLVFLLNLSVLGDLRIETRIYKEEIAIQITGSNPNAVAFIQAHVPELEKPLREEGFSLSVSTRHEEEVSMEIAGGLDQLLINNPLQLVDVKT